MKTEALLSLLGDRPVAYHPILARALQHVPAAVFLSQLLYWHGRGKWGSWTYKTREDFTTETGLSRRNQESARRRLKKLAILEEDLRGVPATLHYKIDLDRLQEVLLKYLNGEAPSLSNLDNLDCANRANCKGQTAPSISETTQENTTGSAEALSPIEKNAHPAIEIFVRKAGHFPPKPTKAGIIDAVGHENGNVARWGQVVYQWISHGWNPRNISGMLEYFQRGEIPGQNSHPDSGGERPFSQMSHQEQEVRLADEPE